MHILNLNEWTPLCYGFICTLYFYNKVLLNSYEEDLKQFNFHQRAKTIFGEFCRHSIKNLKNLAQHFQVSIPTHPCHQ